MNRISVNTVDTLMKRAKFREAYNKLPKGKYFKDLSTIIVIPTRGVREEKAIINCKKCKHKNEYVKTMISGLNAKVVQSWKNIIKPMNTPVIETIVSGLEVGEAYNQALEMIFASPGLKDFKYLLTMEDDNIVPFIPNSPGPLMMLYEQMDKFDVAGGLYWTKGDYSLPLIYGDPKEGRDTASGMFKVRNDWKPGDIVECNGMGMGFTLFKLDIFKDKRLEKPYFKTVSEATDAGTKGYTQDLYFFEKIRKLGYRVCVDTRVRLGHMDVRNGVIY